jgi:hypothetical protein
MTIYQQRNNINLKYSVFYKGLINLVSIFILLVSLTFSIIPSANALPLFSQSLTNSSIGIILPHSTLGLKIQSVKNSIIKETNIKKEDFDDAFNLTILNPEFNPNLLTISMEKENWKGLSKNDKSEAGKAFWTAWADINDPNNPSNSTVEFIDSDITSGKFGRLGTVSNGELDDTSSMVE